MSNASAFFDSLMGSAIVGINTAMPCKVLSYDASACAAKIQPLFKVKEVDKEPKTLPPIEDVPVLFQRYKVYGNSNFAVTAESVEMIPDLKADDIVQVIFNQRAIDDAQTGALVYPGTARMFSIHDAVIVGVFRQ